MSECDLLDLATVTKIQSQGFLALLYSERDGVATRIRNVSSNIVDAPFSAASLRHDPYLFIGRDVSECFSEHVVEEMSVLLQRCSGREAVCCSFVCTQTSYFLTLTRTRDGSVFEFLPNNEKTFDATSHARDLQRLMSHTQLDSLFEAACTMVTDTVGYDRSLVYQFQDDLSGKVVYEKIRPSLEGTIDSYMGLYFPESDIPLPARQMFMVRPLRVIFDNDTDPVDVVGKIEDDTPDLSKCTLRANHPVHASYMKNMGLCASMSIGIVVENELWGLMCFHAHDRAVHPQGWVITFFESLSVPLSICISKIYRDDYDRRQSAFSSTVYNDVSSTDVFGFFVLHATDLLKVLEADCVSIKLGDRMKSWGDADLVATRSDVEKVFDEAVGRDWAIDELGDPSRGVVCIAHGDLVAVFIRKSVAEEKTWAGDPSHIKIRRPDGVLGPRGSFERYVQSGADSLNRWSSCDKKLATHVSSRIKLLVTTMESVDKKVNALMVPTDTPKGQVEYITAATNKKQPVLDAALLSHFSHLLKTPLHGIFSAFELMSAQDDMTQDETRKHAGDGLKSVRALTNTINSVLSIVAGDDHSNAIHASLEKLSVQALLETLRKERAENSSGTFSATSSTIDKEHDHLMVNRSMLHDTLRTIINNSFTQTTDPATGTTHLSVTCCSTHREATMAWTSLTKSYSHRNIRNSEEALSRISDTDTWYTFSVRDSGCGIHSDMLDNVLAYNDNARRSIALQNTHQGVELDMYTCISNVVFDMNGSVGIASTVSEGTIVSIMLPAQAVIDNDGASSTGRVKIDPSELGVFLVVDDNNVNRKLAAKLVKVACTRTFGVAPKIKEFADGRTCTQEIKKMREKGQPILGILMDFHMPVMSGKEATALIRESEARENLPTIPIFGFTADSTDIVREELLESGMDDVLPKPLSMKILENACLKMMASLGKKS